MQKKKTKKTITILTSVLATLAVYTGALAIFLYVQGWRFDFGQQTVKQVGVLTIESSPTSADIYVDGEPKGRTNKSMTLDIGKYDVTVSKEGYHDWNKQVEILEEKSTPIFPFLILSDPTSKELYQSDLDFKKSWSDRYNNHLILLLEDENSFELVQYNINKGFLTLNTAPINILSISKNIEEDQSPITDITLNLSPSGEMAIMTIITEEESNKYVIPTTRPSTYSTILNTPLELNGFKNYNIFWSEDENFLILESDTDVISYDLSQDTKYVLLKKTNNLDRWSTDSDGYFYTFQYIDSSEENVLKYSLKQYSMDGSGEIVVIPEIYFQKNAELIEAYRQGDFDFGFFTNSPQNTQSVGEIVEFKINNYANGLFIKTTQATYWYDTSIDKYITISPFPAELIQFSPDNDKLLIKTPSKYQIFVFDKEEGDHTISIGTHDIKNLNYEQIDKIGWLSNSSYLQFEEDNSIYICDKDGNNKTLLLDNGNILYWTITSSRDELLTLTEDEESGVRITSYKIY
jgi:hypothetical protein